MAPSLMFKPEFLEKGELNYLSVFTTKMERLYLKRLTTIYPTIR
jgi:hypothetical protein